MSAPAELALPDRVRYVVERHTIVGANTPRRRTEWIACCVRNSLEDAQKSMAAISATNDYPQAFDWRIVRETVTREVMP